MNEQENQRAVHLMILLVYTFLAFGLVGESLLLGWDTGAIVLLLAGVVASWTLHITERIPASIRIWLYFILTMLTFFFYGIHETSIYDLAPLMITVIIMYSSTEQYNIIRLCVATYFVTMCYGFVFVMDRSMEFDSLVITRTILHFVLVYTASILAKRVIQNHKKERKSTDSRISELEETNHRIEDFLTNVSHELRTPINAVTGITTVMLNNEEDIDKRNNILSVQKAGYRLFDQIEDILDYTEVDTGKITVSEDAYMISSLVSDIIHGKRLIENENMLELIFDVDADIPSVLLGDERKIKKILKHLIDNAFKFTKKGGIYVRIYAIKKPYGINLCISVSDTGIGIDEGALKKIRDRFYQANGGRNRKAGGLGLGLSIVYGMVSAMEGFIQVESTVGEGTTVSVSIPQKVSNEEPSMVVDNQEDLCLACFIRTEKYENPKVRDYYDKMISHLVQELSIPLHRVFDIEELQRLTSMYQLTHLFIGKEEYTDNQSYFESLDRNINVCVVADPDFVLPNNSRMKFLRKPFFTLSIANVLNAEEVESEAVFKEKHMICPGIRVLVVDDEPMNLMVAEGIFKDYQMDVTTAESGRKAINLCEEEEFDLIFLDHMMPEMDGVETLKRLRKISTDTGRVPTVIAFTANAVSGAREMFLREGFDEFLSKPIEPLELKHILRKVLPKSAISFVDKEFRKIEKNETAGEKDKLIQLQEFGINTHSGIQYSSGDKEFYMELLTKFAKDATQKETEINDFFQQEDYDNYCIQIHALKSTAKMIGADLLSEKAKHLEMAAKNHDASYIRENHGELASEYHQLVKGISGLFDFGESSFVQESQEDSKTEPSKKELLQQLKKLQEGLETFEAEKAESILSEMKKDVYPGISIEELLCDVQQTLDNFEFTLALEKVEAFIKKVEGGEV